MSPWEVVEEFERSQVTSKTFSEWGTTFTFRPEWRSALARLVRNSIEKVPQKCEKCSLQEKKEV